jgi:hypothetical protein
MSDESLLGLLLRAHAGCAAQAHGEKYVFDNIVASSQYENAVTNIECAIRQIGFAEMSIARQGDKRVSK